jgi:hypothetical protein
MIRIVRFTISLSLKMSSLDVSKGIDQGIHALIFCQVGQQRPYFVRPKAGDRLSVTQVRRLTGAP